MKNNSVARLTRAAKQYHRTKRGDQFDNGIMIFHRYDAADTEKQSWWDDVTFILNDYRVALAWVHPRMVYDDLINDEVDRITADIKTSDLLQNSTSIYKSVGNSRKKISSWRCTPVDRSDWREQRQQARKQVTQTANYQVTPYLTSHWCEYSRLVSLCAPFEVRNEADLRSLAAMTKRLLKREVSLKDLFPNYSYTKADWERENLHLADTGVHSHAVA